MNKKKQPYTFVMFIIDIEFLLVNTRKHIF